MAAARPDSVTHSITLSPDLSEVSRGRAFLAEIASGAGFPEGRVFDISVACSEAMANAIEHSPVKGEVQVRAVLHVNRLEIEIEGPGEFQAPDRLKERGNRGLGLPLMAKLSDHLALFSGPSGQTFVSLTFYRPGADIAGEGAVAPTFANLAEENRLLDDVLRNFPEGFYVLDQRWRFIYVNPALAASAARKPEELLGTVIWEAFPEREPSSRPVLERARATGSTVTVMTHDPRGSWRESTIFALEEGLAVISRDVTRRMEAEERLRERSQLLDLSFEAVLVWELDGPIRYWNRGAEATYGFSAGEAVGKVSHRLLATVFPLRLPAILEALRVEGTWSGELLHTTKDGRTLTVESRMQLLAADGRALVLESNRNVTERKQAEEERARLLAEQQVLNEELAAANEELAAMNEELASQTEDLIERERLLRESEERFQRALANGPVSLAAQDRALRYIWSYNQANMGLYDIVGKTDHDVFPRQADHLTAIKRELLETGRPRRERLWIDLPQQRFFLDIRFIPVRDGKGRVSGIWMTSVDLTEQQLAEDELRASEAVTSAFLELSPPGLALLDRDGKILKANSAYRRYVPETMPSRDPARQPRWRGWDAGGEPIRPRDFPGSRALRGEDVSAGLEFLFTDDDGREMWTRVSAVPFRAEDGSIAGAVTAIQDIDRLKRMVQAAEESEERFRSVLESSLDGLYRLNLQTGRYEYASPAFGAIIGWTNEDFMALSPDEALRLVHPDDLRCVHAALRTAESGRSVVVEYRLRGADGGYRWVSNHFSQSTDDEGRPFCRDGIVRDISERKTQELERERLLEAEKELSEDLAAANEELQAQTEELAAQQEELRTQHEELLVLHEGLQEAQRLEQALSRVSESVNSTLELEEILRRVVEDAARALGSDKAVLEIREAGGWRVKEAFRLDEGLKGLLLSVQEASVADAMDRAGTVLVIEDAGGDPRVNRSTILRYETSAALIVPLVVRSTILGSLQLIWTGGPRRFSAPEVDFAKKLSASLALALENARLYESQRLIAEQLQETILEMPADMPHVEFAHLYRPATDDAMVGGDFYDTFSLADAAIAFVIGDVAGHGVNAARVATMVKATLVALAQDQEDPERVLSLLNRLLLRKSVPGFTSLFFCLYHPVTRRLTYCAAGHPDALLVRSAGGIERLAGHHPPLGVFDDWACRVRAAEIAPGDLLLLYTDGLTEARTNGEMYGEQRLAGTMAGKRSVPLEELPKALLQDVLRFSGGKLQDDVAILAVRML